VVSTTPRPFYSPGKTRYPLYRRLGGPLGPVWTCAKNLAPTGIFYLFCRILFFIVLVLDFQLSFVSYRTACCGFFQQEKSEGFGRERTRDLGYQRPACKPLDHRSRLIRSPDRPARSQVAIQTELPGPFVRYLRIKWKCNAAVRLLFVELRRAYGSVRRRSCVMLLLGLVS
jgi:hypothetical protein